MSESLQGTALVIGINAYSAGVKPLQSAVTDARAIADILRDQHAYDVTLLLDEQATAESIFRILEADYPQRLAKDGAFLLYFAGHGVACGDGSEGPQGYLLPCDATLGDQQSWLPMDRLRKALEALPSKHLLVILDCCFAGSFRWASTRDVMPEKRPLYDSQYERYLNGTAWQALTSASHNQTAMDVSPGYANTRDSAAAGTHSPFALALIQGLAGAADSSRGGHEPDGVITATELFQYAFEEICAAGEPPRQTPGIWPLRPDNTGEYIFRNPRLPRKTLPDPPLDGANNPWMGLAAYSSKQAPLFFGREKITGKIVNFITAAGHPRLVAVVGASGTGKSSVVKAGVLPRLEHPADECAAAVGQWTVVRSPRLAGDPVSGLQKLAVELAALENGGEKLLFIDQFEELYTQCHEPELRERYLELLRELVDKAITVVLTLRSDFEPQPARAGALADVWAKARILVPAFSGEEFRECIEGPAAVKALYFEPQALVGELVDEVMAMPGALPVLSFALAEMYRCAQLRRRASGSNDRALMREDYAAIGGVVGALHRRASALYDAGTPAVQASIQRVFLRMIAQDGARLTRRRISSTELEYADRDEQARVEQLQRDFVEARLLVVDAGTIEPAHDTLVVAWEKLLDWLSAAGPQDLIRAVWHAALDWQRSHRALGLSWHDDPRLPLALSKREQLNRIEQTFVDASEANRKRRVKRAIGGAVIVGAVILMSALIAWQQRNDAVEQKRIALEQEASARHQRDRAQASALLTSAQAQTDPVTMGLAVSEIFARRLPPPARAAEVARQAFDKLAVVDGYTFRNGTGWDIRRLQGADYITYQTLLGDRVDDSWSFEPVPFRNRPQPNQQHGRVLANAFTANDRSVYTSYEDGTTIFWPEPLDSETAVAIADPVADLAADESGRIVVFATGNEARVLTIGEEANPIQTRVLGTHATGVVSIALTPDARLAATGTADGEVRLWDVATGELLEQRTLGDSVASVALGNNGEFLAAGSTDGTIKLWHRRVSDAAPQVDTPLADTPQIGQCGGELQMLTLSPRSQVLAAVCAGQAWLWSTHELSIGRPYPSSGLSKVKFVLWPGSYYPGGPWPGAFSHDGLWLIGLNVPNAPIAWPVITAAVPPAALPEARPEQRDNPLNDAGPGVADRPGQPAATEPFAAGQLTATGHLLGFQVTLTPDQQYRVKIVLRQLETLEEVAEEFDFPWGLEPDQFPVDVDTTGGHILAIATEGTFWTGVLFTLGHSTGMPATARQLEGTLLRDALFSPDGSQLLVISDRMNPNIIHADPRLIDTSTLAVVRVLGGQRFVAHGEFSADGSRIVTADCYGESRVWNADGSGDPVIFNARDDDSEYLCGDDEGMYTTPALPKAWFSADSDYLYTQVAGEKPELHAIGFGLLSEQIRNRTFACLTPTQRVEFLAETPGTARAAYDHCMAALGYVEP
ncbi:MAG: nSTAND1 domain-containing NTPase [Lysobacterales bacterium]